MKNHSIILARGGSKGIKNKNLKKVGGKPLIFWSIKASLNSKKISKTWVSSDSDKILKYASKLGADIIRRNSRLSNDSASSEVAWLHAVKHIEKQFVFDNVVGMQPTSPIKSSLDLDKALLKFEREKFDSLVSTTPIKDYFVWTQKKKLIPLYDQNNRKRRQEISTKYLENGSFYIFNKDKFKKQKNRLFGIIGQFIQNKTKSFQVDDLEDLFIVHSLLSSKKIKKFNK